MTPWAAARWTQEEDKVLRQECQRQKQDGNSIDWTVVASTLPNRSNKDCRKRWTNHAIGGLRKGSWETTEDDALRQGVATNGQSWAKVSKFVGTRSADQCAKRWCHQLDPQLDRSDWTDEENERLVQAVTQYDRQWLLIKERCFPKRSTNSIKNQHTVLVHKMARTLTEENNPSIVNTSTFSPASKSQARASHADNDRSGDAIMSGQVMAGHVQDDTVPLPSEHVAETELGAPERSAPSNVNTSTMDVLPGSGLNDLPPFAADFNMSDPAFLNFMDSELHALETSPSSIDDFNSRTYGQLWGSQSLPMTGDADNKGTKPLRSDELNLDQFPSMGNSTDGIFGMDSTAAEVPPSSPMVAEVAPENSISTEAQANNIGGLFEEQNDNASSSVAKSASYDDTLPVNIAFTPQHGRWSAQQVPSLRMTVPKPSQTMINDLMGVVINHQSHASFHLEKE